MASTKPIAIYYEHPDWFRPLFDELDRRGTPYEALDANRHSYDATNGEGSEYGLVFNRISPSAYFARAWPHDSLHATLPGAPGAVGSAGREWRPGVPRRNIEGVATLAAEVSGAALPAIPRDQSRRPGPRSRRGPSISGSGQGQHRRRTYLYAINVYSTGESFNLCPADICQTTDGAELTRAACPADAAKNNLRVEGFTPPPEVIADVERIMTAAGIEIGGVEYIVDSRDGQRRR